MQRRAGPATEVVRRRCAHSVAEVLITAALAVSVALSLVGSVVSAWEILWREFRPNLVSRFVWSSATVIGFATAVADGAGWAAVPIGGLAAGSVVVTVAALIKGSTWAVDATDVTCGLIAVAGLAAWKATGDPGLATIAAITADGVAAVPTLRHAWRAPEEESWLSYSFGGVAALIGLGALEQWTVASAGFSAYLVVLCAALVALICTRRRRTAAVAAA